ncbi:MAG: DUF1580 domain-containing protein [Planctomycetaceae bacterium]|nr:DUF1580 domain-containing protein [Planctomycetaceae bacterium]
MPTQELIPLVEAVQKVTGRRLHLSTVLRWCQRPNRHGLRLESWIVGGRRLTSIQAVQRYIDANTRAADRYPIPSQTNRQAKVAHDSAMAELKADGI